MDLTTTRSLDGYLAMLRLTALSPYVYREPHRHVSASDLGSGVQGLIDAVELEEAPMVAMVQPVAVSPSEALAARLDDPGTAAALNAILDHVDLLAVVVAGLGEFVSRGDTITDSLAAGARELSQLEQGSGLDVGQLVNSAKELGAAAPALLDALPKLVAALPALEQLLGSGLADPQVIELGSAVARAAVTGAQNAQGTSVSGFRALLRALKDDDVARSLGFALSVAKALGQALETAPHRPAHQARSN